MIFCLGYIRTLITVINILREVGDSVGGLNKTSRQELGGILPEREVLCRCLILSVLQHMRGGGVGLIKG